MNPAPISRRALLGAALSLFVAACATTPEAPPVAPPKPKPVRIGLVLGGGAARGFSHIGVIKALEAQGIEPQVVVGTSAGSVVGALYSAGYSGFDLQKMAFELDQSSVGDITLPDRGFVKGEALQNYINKAVRNQPIEKLKRTFGAVAANLNTGEAVLFTRGNTGMAVRASSSVPGVFQPVRIGNADYVDGGVVSPVPVHFAKQLGADFVIAVDVSSKPSGGDLGTSKAVLLQSVVIMGNTITQQELKLADVVIRPNLAGVDASDFNSKHSAILEGEKAAQALMPLIKQKLAERR